MLSGFPRGLRDFSQLFQHQAGELHVKVIQRMPHLNDINSYY